MTKINTVANNGLTIVENYNKLLEQFRKAKTIDDVRILVASAKDFISVYKRVDKNMVNEIYDKLQSKLQDMVAENAFVYDRMNNRVEEIRIVVMTMQTNRTIHRQYRAKHFSLCLRCLK